MKKTHKSPRLPMFLNKIHRRLLYLSFFGIWLSGGIWVLLFYFGQIEGEFGLTPNPFAPLTLKIHGLFALSVWMGLGSVLPAHIVRAWHMRRNIFSGFLFICILCLLGISGWYLYYADNEIWRENTAFIHWILGLFLPIFILIHIYFGKKSREGRHE